jgi:hypothetical protein
VLSLWICSVSLSRQCLFNNEPRNADGLEHNIPWQIIRTDYIECVYNCNLTIPAAALPGACVPGVGLFPNGQLSGGLGVCQFDLRPGFDVWPLGSAAAADVLIRRCLDGYWVDSNAGEPNPLPFPPDDQKFIEYDGLRWASEVLNFTIGDPILLVAELNPNRICPFTSPASGFEWDWQIGELDINVSSAYPSLSIPHGVTSAMNASDKLHVTVTAIASDSPCVGQMHRTLTLQPAVPMQVTAPLSAGPSYDPCDASSPCRNGGKCSSSRVGLTSTYNLACQCLHSPIAFFGPICSFSVLGCPRCTSTFDGDRNITLVGIGLEYMLSVSVHGEPVGYHSRDTVRATDDAAIAQTIALLQSLDSTAFASVTSLDTYTFLAPPLVNRCSTVQSLSFFATRAFHSSAHTHSMQHQMQQRSSHGSLQMSLISATDSADLISSYQPLDISALLPANNQVQSLSYPTLVYYSSSGLCLEPGQWKPDGHGGCLPCPRGAYCTLLAAASHMILNSDCCVQSSCALSCVPFFMQVRVVGVPGRFPLTGASSSSKLLSPAPTCLRQLQQLVWEWRSKLLVDLPLVQESTFDETRSVQQATEVSDALCAKTVSDIGDMLSAIASSLQPSDWLQR